ncbi:MAG: hypothetical protein Q8M94_16530, partial [Ignavibacteria bacterium]|nr:hypothetical protein [Ignavibacteria bacterium]
MTNIITDDELRTLPGPNQIFYEWKIYLQFIKVYFEMRGILSPIIVEIGTQTGHQKAHYKKFLNGAHIGIDISDEFSKPDILGDSHTPETMAKLKEILNGREVNLLFIDALHTYKDALEEYESYGSITLDIIAFHDIRKKLGIRELWNDLCNRERRNPNLTFFSIGSWGNGWCELGIGMIV